MPGSSPSSTRHHGLLGRAVLQRLLPAADAERPRLVEQWAGRRDIFATQAAGDSLFARQAPQWALLALTATLIQDTLAIPNSTRLEDAVWEAFTSAQQLPAPDRIQQAYEHVRSWAESNRAFFYVRTTVGTTDPTDSRTVYGLINEMEHWVGIFPSVLQAEVARLGWPRPRRSCARGAIRPCSAAREGPHPSGLGQRPPHPHVRPGDARGAGGPRREPLADSSPQNGGKVVR